MAHFPLPALRLSPKPRETVTSFAARLAAAYQVHTSDFLRDNGIASRSLHTLKNGSVAALGRRARLKEQEVEDLVSWSGTPLPDAKMRLRDEVFMMRSLRTKAVRGCLICLREDMKSGDGPMSSRLAIRGDWMLRETQICLHHEHPLDVLWEEDAPSRRYDFAARMAELVPVICEERTDGSVTTRSAYDCWLHARLTTGTDTTFLDGIPVQPTAVFSKLLGGEMRRIGAFQDDDARHVHAIGFDILVSGPDAIGEAFEAMERSALGAQDGPPAAYGLLHRALELTYSKNSAFDIYRDMLRERIFDRWPIAAGETVLGKALTERRTHSVRSAALEAGYTESLMDRLLLTKGVPIRNQDASFARMTFDARGYSLLLRQFQTYVGTQGMHEALGATRNQFRALVAAGLIEPVLDPSQSKRPWNPEDGKKFLSDLRSDSSVIADNTGPWMHVHDAVRAKRIPLGPLVRAVRDGRIQIGTAPGLEGYASIFVQVADVDAVFFGDTARDETVAEFAVRLGLKNQGSFGRLVRDGHTSATMFLNEKTCRTELRMTAADIEAYRSRFVSKRELAAAWSMHARTMEALLHKKGVEPYQAGGVVYEGIYLRAEVEPLRSK